MKLLKIYNHVFNVSDEDFETLSMIHWRISNERGYIYAIHPTLGKMHRYILGIIDPKIYVDHKDGNTLNCQRNNLRKATPQQNCFNSKVHKDSYTGYKGVYYVKKSNNYRVIISSNGKKVIVNGFNTKYEAMVKYNSLAKIIHGEFARLNIPTFEDQFKCYLRGETNICPTIQN